MLPRSQTGSLDAVLTRYFDGTGRGEDAVLGWPGVPVNISVVPVWGGGANGAYIEKMGALLGSLLALGLAP